MYEQMYMWKITFSTILITREVLKLDLFLFPVQRYEGCTYYINASVLSASVAGIIFLHKWKSLTFGKYATFLCIALMANCMSCKYI